MNIQDPNRASRRHTVVVGAGFGGLVSALLLRARGWRVTLIERHDWVGGKARTVPSDAGPVAAGPTVLTLRHVFDHVVADTGARLDELVTLYPEPLLARHFWPDGSILDLTDDRAANIEAIERFSGAASAKAFCRFAEDAETLFTLFDTPMMRTASPSMTQLARAALSAPRNLGTLAPFNTLARTLQRRFKDPRLQQLFGRYATYVGGAPNHVPALLSLIWRAEEAGVWRVEGGMHRLALALADRFRAIGGDLRCGMGVREVVVSQDRVTGVLLDDGSRINADEIVFNGDPRAFGLGLMGDDAKSIAPTTRTSERSLSARVWSFAAAPNGADLVHHNVFFAQRLNSEFAQIDAGQIPQDPTLYVCAEDRATGADTPRGIERFEIILNAAPLTKASANTDEAEICRQVTFPTLARFGLTFSPEPGQQALATPTVYDRLFPGSAGSLYGQSPHGLTAALKRPRARTAIQGLYLAGGGTHPGAGVPMAALSGRHAAEAIMRDHALT